jgi:hypothetical protein
VRIQVFLKFPDGHLRGFQFKITGSFSWLMLKGLLGSFLNVKALPSIENVHCQILCLVA